MVVLLLLLLLVVVLLIMKMGMVQMLQPFPALSSEQPPCLWTRSRRRHGKKGSHRTRLPLPHPTVHQTQRIMLPSPSFSPSSSSSPFFFSSSSSSSVTSSSSNNSEASKRTRTVASSRVDR